MITCTRETDALAKAVELSRAAHSTFTVYTQGDAAWSVVNGVDTSRLACVAQFAGGRRVDGFGEPLVLYHAVGVDGYHADDSDAGAAATEVYAKWYANDDSGELDITDCEKFATIELAMEHVEALCARYGCAFEDY